MFDILKEKTNKSVDKSIDNTREAARIIQNDANITTSLHQREPAGVKTEKVSDDVKTGFPTSVPDAKIAAYGAGPALTKAEI
ncbi:MAG: hypothetical protein M0Q91_01005 [Methanoregula sp.]|jgi:hypothetical protein|nr:hypothetical protein [Methanoregula sp.]